MEGDVMAMDFEKQIVHTTSLFKADDNFDDARFMRVRVAVMHSGTNRNNSRFSTDCIKAAEKSFANIPILADVQEYVDKDGNKYLDYSGHSMHIEQDAFDEESNRLIYDEKVVGIVPETNDFEIIHDDETGNDYAYVTALLYREYGNYVCDILEARGGLTDVSAEIACEDIAYDAQDKVLDVGKMQMCAVTLLGESVQPGMAKAHAQVFSSTSEDRESQMMVIMKELTEALNSYKEISRKGGISEVENEKILDEVTEIMEEVTAEETTEEVTVEEEFSEATEEITPEENTETEFSEEEPEAEPDAEEEPVVDLNSVQYSMTIGDTRKDFSVSLSDVIYALQSLVNETYSETDNDWYYCDVYAEEKYVVMHGWMKSYRQSYKCKKDKYSLVGDRVEVFAQYLTADEIAKLDEMRNNYSLITEKLAKYEAEPEKTAILESEDYKYVANTEEFVELVNNHFDLATDEVKAQADAILLDYAKKGAFNFSVETEAKPEIQKKALPELNKKTSRYGTLFAK